MRILLATAEVHPFSKSGGLADMVAALAKSLARAGHTVGLVTPLYRGLHERFQDIRSLDWNLSIPLGGSVVEGKVWGLDLRRNLTYYFIEQPGFFNRADLYQENGVEYPDNAERFVFFDKAVVQVARKLPWKPEVVHVHDWHAALVPLLIKHELWRHGWYDAPKTCLTIHNLAYQGHYGAPSYGLTNLPWDYFHPDGAEFHGGFCFLKSGIAYSDAITTVSPSYAKEITTTEFGCGLEGILQVRHNVLQGILNGVDYDEWRTTGNRFLPEPYSAKDPGGKVASKLALQEEFQLVQDAKVPLFGSVTRLAHQKGIDLSLPALGELLKGDAQFVLLGSGSPEYQAAFMALAKEYPGKVGVKIGYDHALSHRIEAGCDFFLMPSRFEPCGLNQMYSLRYGTIPIVRATGGLIDSVIDLREDPHQANGIKFHEYSVPALTKALQKALVLYQEPQLMAHLRYNGMTADFSWEETAHNYLGVFRKLLGRS